MLFGLIDFFIELANSVDRFSLTIDYSGINEDSPGRFRTEANNPEFQTCYFNSANTKQVYNKFVSKRINSAKTVKTFLLKLSS